MASKKKPIRNGRGRQPSGVNGDGTEMSVTTLYWADDPQAESVMRSRHLAWEVKKVKIVEINFDASKTNRGRIDEKFSDDRITEYAMSMLDGDAFPRPVLNKMASGQYYILSGNHRCLSVREAEFGEVEAYVVQIDDLLLLDLLPMLFNIHHGVNVPTEAKYEQARYMVLTYKVDKKIAAKDYRISYEGFCIYLRGLEAVDRLAQYGIDGAKLPRAVQVKLNTIVNEHAFTSVGQLLTHFKLDTTRALQLIEEARDAPNELEALQVVARVNDQLVAERRSNRVIDTPVPIRDRLFRQLHGLINMLNKYKSAKACQITTPQDLAAIHAKFQQIVDRGAILFGYSGQQPEAAVDSRPGAQPQTAPRGEEPTPGSNQRAARGRRTTHVR